jgi:hypothetical protein
MHWIDPRSLTPIRGTIEQFVMNRDGELDGLLLSTGTETQLVHFPPHMGGAVERTIKAGDSITVHGVKPRGAAVIAAVSLVPADGVEILDEGPDAPHQEAPPAGDEAVKHDAKAGGVVRLTLYGPKGELRGAVLEDGTAIRLGKKEAQRFADLLQLGAAVAVEGTAIVCRHGTAINAKAIGAKADRLQPVKEKKEDEPDKPKDKKKQDDAHADA